MAGRPTSHAVSAATSVALLLCAAGCASAISSSRLDAQAEALRTTPLTPDTRYAVAARNTYTHLQPDYPIGEKVSAAIAGVVSERLGIEAVPLSHGDESDWANELARARADTGLITATDNSEFFRSAGFDGYVLIALYEKIGDYGRSQASGDQRIFLTYEPVFHMFALQGDKDKVKLLQAGEIERFTCELRGERIRNEAQCIDMFVKRFRRALDARLERSTSN